MAQIVDALLLLAGVKRQSVELDAIDMTALVTQLLRERLPDLLARHGGSVRFEGDLPTAVGYAPWVEEIWVNYLSNALKYGGRPPEIRIRADRRQDFIRYWVADNGAGLDEAARRRLFTPFTRLHQAVDQEGHGLGLSIVQRITDRLGGRCGVESVPGRGSRFYFELPAGS